MTVELSPCEFKPLNFQTFLAADCKKSNEIQKIYAMHYTHDNAFNLAKKSATIHAQTLLLRQDLHKLPDLGRRLVARLRVVEEKKKAAKQARDLELDRVAWWENVLNISSAAAIITNLSIPIFSEFPLISNLSNLSKYGLPSIAILASTVLKSYSTEQNKTMTHSEYYDIKHGLDNERIAILNILEPIIKESLPSKS